jgi:hypothetical protein
VIVLPLFARWSRKYCAAGVTGLPHLFPHPPPTPSAATAPGRAIAVTAWLCVLASFTGYIPWKPFRELHHRSRGPSNRASVAPDRWFGGGPGSTEHTGHVLQAGYGREEFEGRPVIGIINTWSDMNPCHAHSVLVLRDVGPKGGPGVTIARASLSARLGTIRY